MKIIMKCALAFALLVSIAPLSSAISSGAGVSVNAQQSVTVKKERKGLIRSTYAGGRFVVRKTWDGTKWVSRKVWVGTKWTGKKTWKGTKAVARKTKRILY
jgi:hypothetical protein